jgi:hypothetical protein
MRNPAHTAPPADRAAPTAHVAEEPNSTIATATTITVVTAWMTMTMLMTMMKTMS